MPQATGAGVPVEPQAPLGRLSRLGFALVGASGVDEIAASLLRDLACLPGVLRVGLALCEGGGRRLRFTASDRLAAEGTDGADGADAVDWCHIDAYDDVPLTTVVRTGEPVLGDLDALDPRFHEFVAGQPGEVRALAAVPLPGIGSPTGGLVLYLDRRWSFDDGQRRLLEAAARRAADAVRRVRAAGGDVQTDTVPAEPGTHAARVVLDGEPRAAGIARRFLREFLAEVDLSEDQAATAELCLSELVTNAIVHTGSRFELRAVFDTTLTSTLTVSVRDRGGEGADRPAVPPPDAGGDPLRVHGRGLQLVDALADRWGVERDAGGTTVWFALEVEGPPHSASETG